jgi:hypothetical protein
LYLNYLSYLATVVHDYSKLISNYTYSRGLFPYSIPVSMPLLLPTKENTVSWHTDHKPQLYASTVKTPFTDKWHPILSCVSPCKICLVSDYFTYLLKLWATQGWRRVLRIIFLGFNSPIFSGSSVALRLSPRWNKVKILSLRSSNLWQKVPSTPTISKDICECKFRQDTPLAITEYVSVFHHPLYSFMMFTWPCIVINFFK